MTTGKINVSVENIFPLIKKFFIQWSEIFLRINFEWYRCHLKLKHLISIGRSKQSYDRSQIDKEEEKSTSWPKV
jgi:molecular chaperone HtpG